MSGMSSSMWAEKYRPKTLDEIVNQKEIVSRLKNFVQERNLPHLLLVGPAGVGKTTAALTASASAGVFSAVLVLR